MLTPRCRPCSHRNLRNAEGSQHLFFLQSEPRSEYTKTITRIAREIGGVSVGLALGGGAALGLAHIGVLRVLEEENIPIDIIVGKQYGSHHCQPLGDR